MYLCFQVTLGLAWKQTRFSHWFPLLKSVLSVTCLSFLCFRVTVHTIAGVTICSSKAGSNLCVCDWRGYPCPRLLPGRSCGGTGRLGRGSRRNMYWQPGAVSHSFTPRNSDPGCPSVQSGQDPADARFCPQPLVRSFPAAAVLHSYPSFITWKLRLLLCAQLGACPICKLLPSQKAVGSL